MPRKSERKTGVKLSQYEAAQIDCCNFHREDTETECGEPAVTAVVVTDADGHGVLLKLCRHHLARLSVLLVEELE